MITHQWYSVAQQLAGALSQLPVKKANLWLNKELKLWGMHRNLSIKNYWIRLLINFCLLDNIINKMTKQLNYSFNSAYSQINNLEITTK